MNLASTSALRGVPTTTPRARVIARAAGQQLQGPRVVKGPVFVTRDVSFFYGRVRRKSGKGTCVGAHPRHGSLQSPAPA